MNTETILLESGGVMNAEYLDHARRNFVSAESESSFIEYCGRPLRKSIRYNSLKVDQTEFLQVAEHYGWQLQPIPWCEEGFWLDLNDTNTDISLGNLPEHIQGMFYIQEASSMLPPVALLAGIDLSEPLLVADFAAAPGSKTTQLAAKLNNQGLVLANELSASRLKGLHSNLVRCGIINTCMSHLDGRNIGNNVPELFDLVLLDAPCGGEGTVRKDKDALKNWRLEQVQQLASVQKELLLSAYQALKPGGRLVYSTCTLSPEENQQVANFLVDSEGAEIVDLGSLFVGAEQARTEEGYLLVLPQLFDSEGFFIACLSKPLHQSNLSDLTPIFSAPFNPLDRKTSALVEGYFQQNFGLTICPEGYHLLQRDKEIWLFPLAITKIAPFLKVNRAGMKIASVFPGKVRATHEFCCCFGSAAQRQTVNLTASQASAYYQGKNIEIEKSLAKDGEVILKFKGRPLAMGLNKRGQVKNALPRDLVRDHLVFDDF